MVERCNCDASCGENRYHDLGDVGCEWYGREASYYYEDLTQQIEGLKSTIRKKDSEIAELKDIVEAADEEALQCRILLSKFVDEEDIDTLMNMVRKYGKILK